MLHRFFLKTSFPGGRFFLQHVRLNIQLLCAHFFDMLFPKLSQIFQGGNSLFVYLTVEANFSIDYFYKNWTFGRNALIISTALEFSRYHFDLLTLRCRFPAELTIFIIRIILYREKAILVCTYRWIISEKFRIQKNYDFFSANLTRSNFSVFFKTK